MCEIQKSDVVNVADSLGVCLSDEKIKKVLEYYELIKDNDPTATWNLIVEDAIYHVIEETTKPPSN